MDKVYRVGELGHLRPSIVTILSRLSRPIVRYATDRCKDMVNRLKGPVVLSSVGKPRMNLGTRTPARLSVKKVVAITAIWRDYFIYILPLVLALR